MSAPTIVRALDSNGDWTFGGGDSNYLEGNAAIEQQIKCRLLEFTGNCFWNPQGGLNWPGLLGQRNNQQVLNLQIGSIILNTNGVTSIQQLNVQLNRNTRNLSISWVVTTVFSIYSSSFQASIPQPVGG
jgi:hypothetical protein